MLRGKRTKFAAGDSLFRSRTLVAVFFLFSNICAMAQTSPGAAQHPLPPGVQVRIAATPKVANVGDPIQIDLDITMPPGYQAEVVKPGRQAEDFFVSGFFLAPALPEPQKTAEPKSLPQNEGLVHHRVRIVAAVYRTGSLTFPPFPIQFRTADGKRMDGSSPPLKIEIQSVLSDRDRNLKDLKKQIEIPEPVRWRIWLIILLALGILSVLSWLLWKRRPTHAASVVAAVPPQDMLEMAEAELRELLARGVPEGAAVKSFYVRLSEIVKMILEACYGVGAAERTTSEIMESLHSQPGRKLEEMEPIELFLLRCDMVKFAKYVPSKAEHEDAGNSAFRILEMSRKSVASGQSPVGSGSSRAEDRRLETGN